MEKWPQKLFQKCLKHKKVWEILNRYELGLLKSIMLYP